MKTKFAQKRRKSSLMIFCLTAMMVIVLSATPYALASTAENTTITNTVTVTYDDASNNSQDAITAQATVTVALLPSAPTIDSPPNVDDATEGQAITLTYTVIGNANGDDTYTISTGIVEDLNLGEEVSVDINGGTPTITLGGTTLVADTDGTTAITVPFDGNDADNAVNSIEEGDWVVINGVAYQVDTGGIDESSGATTNTATITFTAAPPIGSGSAGDVVGEQMQIDVVVTTGDLNGTATSSTHTVTATIASGTHSVDQTTSTVITVLRPLLTVVKYVQVVNGPQVGGSGSSYGPIDTGSGAGSITYWQAIDASPTAILEYIIVVENPDPLGGQATNVVIEDSIPQFTSYVLNSMRLDPGTGVFSPLLDAAANPDEGEYDSGSEAIWIYAGSGGDDGGAGYGDGTGGTLNAGDTTIGVFRVTID